MAPSRAFLRLQTPPLRQLHRSTHLTSVSSSLPLNPRTRSLATLSPRQHPTAITRRNSPLSAHLPPPLRTAPFSTAASDRPEPPDYLNDAERHIFDKIRAELDPVKLEVQDISGGCGSMYALEIVSPKFKGLTIVKQHKLVNSILADEIKSWHGVQLRTRPA
ncbi:bola-like protein [Sporormia fimetaria CBS 119925]|uniref:Bola-like protein n=1 Tax=Sporormia fimetaria CBS 119925 TaxID=1340428 RepID=A0A6A6VNY9_9PLEO|nr:bola-like protein [Sporormia fimetaria CBS 119925]